MGVHVLLFFLFRVIGRIKKQPGAHPDGLWFLLSYLPSMTLRILQIFLFFFFFTKTLLTEIVSWAERNEKHQH